MSFINWYIGVIPVPPCFQNFLSVNFGLISGKAGKTAVPAIMPILLTFLIVGGVFLSMLISKTPFFKLI